MSQPPQPVQVHLSVHVLGWYQHHQLQGALGCHWVEGGATCVWVGLAATGGGAVATCDGAWTGGEAEGGEAEDGGGEGEADGGGEAEADAEHTDCCLAI